jgi:hypothetical protein
MPKELASSFQLDLFIGDSPTYQEALARYEEIRPVVKGERTLAQHSQETGLPYWRLWRNLRRFGRDGLRGLMDRRKLFSHPRGKPAIEERLPQHIQQHVVRLAIAHPFTQRELATSVQEAYQYTIDYRGIQRVLELHHLSPEALKLHHQKAQQVPLPPLLPAQQMELPLVPTTKAHRLERALGPDHLLIRFRTYREYPTEEHARWRIIELLEVGFQPRRIAKLLAIQPPVVYYWKRRFTERGLLGLTTRRPEKIPIAARLSVQVRHGGVPTGG